MRGEVYLAPFEYADFAASKRRPVCVVSANALSQTGPDVIVAMLTSNAARLGSPSLGDVILLDWEAAGLLRPSVLRAVRLIARERQLLAGPRGKLSARDLASVHAALRLVLDLP